MTYSRHTYAGIAPIPGREANQSGRGRPFSVGALGAKRPSALGGTGSVTCGANVRHLEPPPALPQTDVLGCHHEIGHPPADKKRSALGAVLV